MKKTVSIFIALLLLAGCLSGVKNGDKQMKKFNFGMTRQVGADFNMMYEGVSVDILISSQIGSVPDETATKLSTILTDSNGKINTRLAVPTYVKELWIKAEHTGISNEYVKMPIIDNKVQYNYVAEYKGSVGKRISRATTTSPSFIYMGGWNSLGVPTYLEKTRDIVSTSFSALVKTYLPTSNFVNTAYVANEAETNIKIINDADLWITFLNDNTTLKNSLGYYTYNTESGPPDQAVTDGAITILFPNTSLTGTGGGGLTIGDKVKVGNFKKGTTVAFVLIAGGYNAATQKVTGGSDYFFSNELMNPENDLVDKPHSVLLNMSTASVNKRIVMGFKDTRWGVTTTSSNDFNDVVFYLTTTDPANSADTTQIAIDTKMIVDPAFDSSVYNSALSTIYTPGSNKFATLVYKDTWPNKGDFDFNDAVVDYNFTETTSSQAVNGVVKKGIIKIYGKFVVRVSLAGGNNGFAFELPIDSSYIKSVTGYKKVVIGTKDPKHQEYFFFNSKVAGLERDDPNISNGQNKKAVILVADNIKPYVNTTIGVTITLTEPMTREQLGFAPYNPFLMSDGNRGREIHLPGDQPTKFANVGYFNSLDDKSQVGTDYTYKTADGSPWCLNIPESFYYTYDGVSIKSAYMHFTEWVNSDGTLYTDWFKNLIGYRDGTKIAKP